MSIIHITFIVVLRGIHDVLRSSKIFNIFIHKKMFFERTIYASFNDLKSRSKSLIELYEICVEKRGDFQC